MIGLAIGLLAAGGLAIYFGLPFLSLQTPADFWSGRPRPQYFTSKDLDQRRGATAQGPPKP